MARTKRRHMNTGNVKRQTSRYNSSSIAYDYDALPVQQDKEEKERQLLQRAKARRLLRLEKKDGILHGLKLFVATAVVFAGCILTMSINASITEERVKINKMKDQLIVLQNENESTEAELSDQLSLDYIKEQATGRLGMSEPQPYQICYIDVPKQSYTVQSSIEIEEEQKRFDLQEIFSFFRKGFDKVEEK
ncbi:MAG: hypothetical protein KHZ62_04445 [Clostridiales bacterium]|nr:hypothetical protein [Clostridiales bacterium]